MGPHDVVRCVRGSLGLLALVSASAPLVSTRGAAQAPPLPPGRLTVRPRDMATGTRTAQAGAQRLDSLTNVRVYVPPQCVGTRRCPLLFLMGDLKSHAAQADQYGTLILEYSAPATGFPDRPVSMDPGIPHLIREVHGEAGLKIRARVKEVDAALTYVLRHFAVDPDKIAITGNSGWGYETIFLGRNNLDVFSRIIPTSPADEIVDGLGPRNPQVQFYASGGLAEIGFLQNAIEFAQDVRQDGYPVKLVVEPRPHTGQTPRDITLIWRWLHDSWTAPATTRRAAPPRPAPTPLLTADMVQRWTTFWLRLLQEPDSIFGKSASTAHPAYLKEFPLLIGQEPVWLVLTDLPALAARYPSVAADLRAAGLTAQQAEATRLALLSAYTTLVFEHRHRNIVGPVAPTSVLGRNMTLLATNAELLQAMDEQAPSWVQIP